MGWGPQAGSEGPTGCDVLMWKMGLIELGAWRDGLGTKGPTQEAEDEVAGDEARWSVSARYCFKDCRRGCAFRD